MNNKDKFKKHLVFENSDHVYIMMALPRKKDGFPVNTKPDSKHAIRRMFRNLEEYEECFDQLSDFEGYRIYVTFNRRSLRKAFLQLQNEINEKLLLGGYDDTSDYLFFLRSRYRSILMKPKSKAKTDFFLYDIDNIDTRFASFEEEVKEHTEIVLEMPSKNGVHLLVKPFNFNLVDHVKYDIELKHDALTNLKY